jgi:hypothetical protein
MRFSYSAGAASISTSLRCRKFTSAGAYCCPEMRTFRIAAFSSSPEMNCAMRISVSGPVTMEATNTIIAVRRSRSASRTSFQ